MRSSKIVTLVDGTRWYLADPEDALVIRAALARNSAFYFTFGGYLVTDTRYYQTLSFGNVSTLEE
jgi:hypothetical protein